MDSIPTAEEYLNNSDFSHWHDKSLMNQTSVTVDVMIEFSKLHVKAALEAAAENAQIDSYTEDDTGYINKKSILNAYPLDNIK